MQNSMRNTKQLTPASLTSAKSQNLLPSNLIKYYKIRSNKEYYFYGLLNHLQRAYCVILLANCKSLGFHRLNHKSQITVKILGYGLRQRSLS